MANARKILNRRRTVQNIRKITRTMEMVSTARFKRVHDGVVGVRPYFEQLTRLVHNVAEVTGGVMDHPLLAQHPEAPGHAVVVLTSNRGLCGGYNMSVLRMARGLLDELTAQQRPADLYAMGKKAIAHFRFNRIPMVRAEPQFEGVPVFERIVDLANELVSGYTEGRWRSVELIYTEFISTGVQRPIVAKLLPLTELVPDEIPMTVSAKSQQYDFMPDPKTILDRLLPRALRLRLFQAFLDAVVSEQVARMTAMRLANENAEDMIRRLTMQYNRARQTGITTELAEIMSGAEALK